MGNQDRQLLGNLRERAAKLLAQAADRARPAAKTAAGSLESHLVKGLGKALEWVNRLWAKK